MMLEHGHDVELRLRIKFFEVFFKCGWTGTCGSHLSNCKMVKATLQER